tara:strand:+ start:1160 stop:2107 length:948 start_codon:yes stop_codon:yes gene_type:complete
MKNSSFYTPLLHAFLLALTITSCEKFTDGVVQEIPFPDHIPVLTATLIVNDQDDKIFAQISSSASVIDAEGPQPVQGAVVTLTDEGGQTLYTLSESDFYDPLYQLDLENTFGTTSGQITLTVDAPGFDQVTATNTMPSKPMFEVNYEYQGDSTSSPWGGPSIQDVYTINFDNNLGVKKNYLIHIDALYQDTETGNEEWMAMYFQTRTDPRITRLTSQDESSVIMVSDESSSSAVSALHDVQILTKSIPEASEWAPISTRVRVESLSPELASYYLSVDSYLSGGSDFFAEPSLLYSNVSSGFGCFGLSSQTIIEID